MNKDLKLFLAMVIAFLLMVIVLTSIFTIKKVDENKVSNETTITFENDDYVYQVNNVIRR